MSTKKRAAHPWAVVNKRNDVVGRRTSEKDANTLARVTNEELRLVGDTETVRVVYSPEHVRAVDPHAETQPAPAIKRQTKESIGQKVVRTLRQRTDRLIADLKKADNVQRYALIHEALLASWTDGHDDASTAAVRMVDEAHEVTTPAKARRKATPS
jgi:hypothetical protein